MVRKKPLLPEVLLASVAVNCFQFSGLSYPQSVIADTLKSQDAQAKSAHRAGTIVVGIQWEPVSFFPLRGLDSASYYAQSLVYEGLLKYDQDGQVKPGMAQSYQVSDDGLTYRFQLRPNIHFCDGTALGVEDVRTSIELAQSPISPFRGDYQDIEKIDCADDTVTLHLSRRCAPLLSRLVELRILPAKLLKLPDHGRSQMGRTPVGTGPFILTSWESGLELVFAPNPHYWGTKPKMDKLIWRVIPDKTLSALALERGELDVATVDPRSLDELKRSSKPIVVDCFRGSRTVYLGFNTTKPPFMDVSVRQAMACAINRQQLIDKLFGGYAVLPSADVSPGVWFYNPNAKIWPYDLGLSKRLLESAKGAKTGDKSSVQDKHDATSGGGKPLAFRIYTVSDFQDIAELISAYLKDVGVVSEVQVVEYSTLRQRYLQKGDFDAFVWSRSAGPDPECALVWGSKGALNYSRFAKPEIDAILQSGRLTDDHLKRREIYGKLQAILAQQVPWVFLVQPQLLIAHSQEIKHVKQARQGETGLPWDNPLFNAAQWQREE